MLPVLPRVFAKRGSRTDREVANRPELQPVHADSKDLALISAVADYIYEAEKAERALFSGTT